MTLLLAPFLRHNGSYTSWSANNLLVAAEARLLIATADATRLGVVDGDTLSVTSNGASVSLPIQVQAGLPAGLAVAPTHFPGSGVMQLMGKPAASFTVTIAKG
jgi:anaerobic selenocysteine-containing dehydrogenase